MVYAWVLYYEALNLAKPKYFNFCLQLVNLSLRLYIYHVLYSGLAKWLVITNFKRPNYRSICDMFEV